MYYNYAFKNAAEFQQLFKKEHGTRRNKILLSFLKCKEIRRSYPQYLDISSMHELINVCMCHLVTGYYDATIKLGIFDLAHPDYRTDERMGLCKSGDTTCIRLIKKDGDREKVIKLKAGKLLLKIIELDGFGRILPKQVKTYLCECFAEKWQAKASNSKFELVVDDDFASIYCSRNYSDDTFHSCMTDKGFDTFYSKCVDAKAASIWIDGKMYARCVIFTNVKNLDTGETMRLAERQYAENESNHLKRILVDMLIDAGLIDGYKQIGADCHSGHSFVRNDGTEMRVNLEIDCTIDEDWDYVSYQDTFKYYSPSRNKAANCDKYGDGIELDVTDGRMEQDYDEYHDCYCRSTIEVHYNGRWISCDENRLEDFYYIDGEYYHEDECSTCDECGEEFVTCNGYYSDLTEEVYCTIDCRDEAEQRYADDYGYHWDDEKHKWVKNEEKEEDEAA